MKPNFFTQFCLTGCSAMSILLLTPQLALSDCKYLNDLDSAGNRCGGRASSVIPGGEVSGDGIYLDSRGHIRNYGDNNDSYDRNPNVIGNDYNDYDANNHSVNVYDNNSYPYSEDKD